MRPKTEKQIQNEARLYLGTQDDLVLWRNNTGQLNDARGIPVRFGLCVGSSDTIGIYAPRGRLVAIEFKTAVGVATPEQILFLALVRRMGGKSGIVRSIEEAKTFLEQLRNE